MSESHMDILTGNGNLDACRVVLLDPGRHGAAPVIERITAEHFFIRLHTACWHSLRWASRFIPQD
jgi:hypothetical protein